MNLDRRVVALNFGRAAPSYAQVDALQREVERRLLERLDLLRQPPERILDVGAGLGAGSVLLRRRYPRAQVLALDLALPMVRRIPRRAHWFRPIHRLCGDAAALPLSARSVDLLYSNLCLQWIDDLPAVLNEFRRVLRPGGLLLFSTFGPDTLGELRAAFATVDDAAHVSVFLDMHDVGDRVLAAGFRDPVLETERFTLHYPDARAVLLELKALGARNADHARPRGLYGKRRLAKVLAAYDARARDGHVPATWEVIYAHAFAPADGQPIRQGGIDVATFPLDALRRPAPRR